MKPHKHIAKLPPIKSRLLSFIFKKPMYRLRWTETKNPVGDFQDEKADYNYKASGIYIKERGNYECRQEVDTKINQKIQNFNKLSIAQILF